MPAKASTVAAGTLARDYRRLHRGLGPESCPHRHQERLTARDRAGADHSDDPAKVSKGTSRKRARQRLFVRRRWLGRARPIRAASGPLVERAVVLGQRFSRPPGSSACRPRSSSGGPCTSCSGCPATAPRSPGSARCYQHVLMWMPRQDPATLIEAGVIT